MEENTNTPGIMGTPEETLPAQNTDTASIPETTAAVEGASESAQASDQAGPPAAEDPAPDRTGDDPEFIRFIDRVARQAEALRPILPDLDRCFQDPEFIRLTSPDVGLDLRTAYEITHARAVPPRPTESGARGAAGAVPRMDPTSLSRQDRAEIRRRVKAGDRTITF